MSNKDVAIARPIPGGSPTPDEQEPPLTPEQREFAEVIGREIARSWRDAHRDEASVRQPAPNEVRATVSGEIDRLAGEN